MRTSEKTSLGLGLTILAALVFLVIGWFMNIYKFAAADFEPTYKEEIVRGVGIVVAPLGAVAGWFDIGGENEQSS